MIKNTSSITLKTSRKFRLSSGRTRFEINLCSKHSKVKKIRKVYFRL